VAASCKYVAHSNPCRWLEVALAPEKRWFFASHTTLSILLIYVWFFTTPTSVRIQRGLSKEDEAELIDEWEPDSLGTCIRAATSRSSMG
jgi:hypothetical protein